MALPARGTALPVLARSTALLLVAATLGTAAAQVGTPRPFGVPPVSLPDVARASRAAPAGLALEGAVDADTYEVGPGDVFTVSIGGSVPRQLTATVSADGLLAVPEAGTFRAAGRTLAAVRREVGAALQRQFRNVPADLVLTAPREFYVHVSGAVPAPGRVAVPALARVEDALAEAAGGVSPRELAAYDVPTARRVERRPALRNVRLVGQDGAEVRVDLMRYFVTGDTRFNPTLSDGATVRLPAFDPDREGIAVGGAVDRPGTYDARPGDTAADLLAVAAGPDAGGRVAAVRRTRPGAGSTEVPLAEAARLDLQARDQLYVVALEPDAGLAVVAGAVRYPGTYPVVSGRTPLAALVEMAGGLRDDALVRAAYLERTARAEPEDEYAAETSPFGRDLTSRQLDSTDVAVGGLSGFGLLGRRFYAQEVLRTPRVSVDVPAALAGAEAVVLRDGDRLVVPFDLGAVRVFGQVAEAGYVPFVEGRTAGGYVEAAGGRGPSATAIYVVEAGTGRFVEGPDTPVRPGDAVFVDRTPTADSPQVEQLAIQERQLELQDRRDRQQVRFQLLQGAITAVSAVATLLIAYATVTRD